MKLTMMRIEYNEQNIILPDLRLINIFQNNSNYIILEKRKSQSALSKGTKITRYLAMK